MERTAVEMTLLGNKRFCGVITEMSQNSSPPFPPLVTRHRSKSRPGDGWSLLPVEIITRAVDVSDAPLSACQVRWIEMTSIHHGDNLQTRAVSELRHARVSRLVVCVPSFRIQKLCTAPPPQLLPWKLFAENYSITVKGGAISNPASADGPINRDLLLWEKERERREESESAPSGTGLGYVRECGRRVIRPFKKL